MPLAQHPAVHLPVLLELLATLWRSRVLAEEMLGVVFISSVGHGTRSFNRLTTSARRTERIIGFVVMVGTERLAVEDIECLVRKWFLRFGRHCVRDAGLFGELDYLTYMT